MKATPRCLPPLTDSYRDNGLAGVMADFAMGFNEVFTSSKAGSLHKECGLALAAGWAFH